MNTVFAIAGVVIKELYRRKDFYVLFVLSALITIAAGSVNFFKDLVMVRYVKDICLLLIWFSTLIIAVITGADTVFISIRPLERIAIITVIALIHPIPIGIDGAIVWHSIAVLINPIALFSLTWTDMRIMIVAILAIGDPISVLILDRRGEEALGLCGIGLGHAITDLRHAGRQSNLCIRRDRIHLCQC